MEVAVGTAGAAYIPDCPGYAVAGAAAEAPLGAPAAAVLEKLVVAVDMAAVEVMEDSCCYFVFLNVFEVFFGFFEDGRTASLLQLPTKD